MPGCLERRDHLGIPPDRDPTARLTGPSWQHPRHGHYHGHGRRPPLRRSADDRLVGGVCTAIARRIGRDVTIVRVVFVLMALGTFGVGAYVLGWLFIPLEGDDTNIASRAISDRRGIALAIALVPLVILLLLVASSFGTPWLGSFSWTLVISAGALILIWRNASEPEQATLHRLVRPIADVLTPGGPSRRLRIVRLALGALLLVAGLSTLLAGHTTRAFRPLAGLLLVIAALVATFGPWWLRLVRDLVAERQARAIAEERADMAARVHDSVLQTLALIQRQSDRPQQVVQLARAQERELRAWLFEGTPLGSANEADQTFAAGVHRIQHEVEATQGTSVDAVVVGDCPLDEALRGLLAAGKEATVNAAKWSGAPVVSVFAEVEADAVSIFVRDTGSGFDPALVPPDRKGLAESIRGRMARLGGTATIRSSAGAGTEVALSVPRVSHHDAARS